MLETKMGASDAGILKQLVYVIRVSPDSCLFPVFFSNVVYIHTGT
jgi:hypothetical protein